MPVLASRYRSPSAAQKRSSGTFTGGSRISAGSPKEALLSDQPEFELTVSLKIARSYAGTMLHYSASQCSFSVQADLSPSQVQILAHALLALCANSDPRLSAARECLERLRNGSPKS